MSSARKDRRQVGVSPQNTMPPKPVRQVGQANIEGPGRRTASIARSISWSFWWRRALSTLAVDLTVLVILGSVFVWHCATTLPPAATDGITIGVLGTQVVQPDSYVFLGRGLDLATWVLQIRGADGHTYTFDLLPYLSLLAPVFVLTLVIQFFGLFDFFSDTRRVRRKLQPLNDLAVAAEAIGAAAATNPARSAYSDDQGKIRSLEQAISAASVDSPQVLTGDSDLRGIEVALNGLLRQMQEAKLQQMRFVSDASHELRTPIAVVQGYVSMLARWGKTDEAVLDESIEALQQETDHMQELVEQLLFLARGDSGRNTLSRTEFNMAEMVMEVWDESTMIDPDHTWELGISETDSTDARFTMVGDLAMVKQSMRIITQNAAAYSAKGSTVRLSAQATDEGVAYMVQDEGIGMSEQDIRHIFERFWRSDGARSEREGGSGLGLSIAKWIVDAHDGTIEVLSHEGVGTRFTVRFPRTSGV